MANAIETKFIIEDEDGSALTVVPVGTSFEFQIGGISVTVTPEDADALTTFLKSV